MVLSKLNLNVVYDDTMKVEDADKKSLKELYQIEIFGVEVLITIGEPKNTFLKKNIIYLPIYLLKHNRKVLQIGVYELDKKKISFNILDDENLLDFISETYPLLYSFVDRDFILKLYLSPEKYNHQENEKKLQIESIKDTTSTNESEFTNQSEFTNVNDIFIPSNKQKINILQSETQEDAKTYRRNYASATNKSNYWMQKFMTNIFYNKLENEGCGDCFFASVRDAYKSIGLNTTIANLRQLISERVTIEQFNMYKTLYDENKNQIEIIKNEIKNKKNEYKKLKKNISDNIISKTEKIEIIQKNKQLKNEIDNLNDELTLLNEQISNYNFMKNISSIEELKNYMKTSNYWADEWSIGQLEIILKIKFIIFSHDKYLNNDMLNILQCQTGLIDEEIQINNNFDVKYYIMLDYGSSHYELITYKDKSMFLFSELPYDVKVLISDKCLERMSGIFFYITDFVNFKIEYEGQKKQIGGINSNENDGQIMDELYQFGKGKLWDDDIKLYFYNSSSNTFPGNTSGEKIPKDKIKSFIPLSRIKNWRKKLDNFWIQPFVLDGKTWASVEHYYQANKFKNDNPNFYDKFSMDSKSSLSKNPSKAKELGENKNKRPNNILIDKNYDKTIGNVNMYSAQEAKFTQHDDLAKALLFTNRANLYHHRKGNYPIQSTNLMLIRKNAIPIGSMHQ